MKADIELVQEVLSGHRAAFAELVLRHQRSLLRLSYRFTRDSNLAEDVVQETFIKVFQKIHLFEGRSSFKSWLFQIAVNTAKNRLRSKSKDFVNIDDVRLGVEAGAESRLLKKDLKGLVRAEIEKLPLKQKMALKLRIFEDLSFKEVAEIMQCPYDTAKANYRHALMKLRKRLESMHALSELNEIVHLYPMEITGMMVEVEQ